MPATASHPRLRGFEAFVRSTLKQWNVPGLAVGIIAGGEVVLLKGFGLRDTERKLPVTPDTLFALASGTKAFTTLSLALLADEGKLDWDTPLQRYLPSFSMYDRLAAERITPRDMVTHRSGLPRHDLLWYTSTEGRAEMVRRTQFLEPTADLRTFWQYQNLMYMAAGYLAEQLSGLRWEDWVQQRIFEPLGMHRSNIALDASLADDDHALPYRDADGKLSEVPFYRFTGVEPAGGINTCAADMSRWLLLQLNGGVVDGRRLVSEAQLRDMRAPQMVIQQPARYAELPHRSYGMGWFIEPYRGYTLVHHGGNIDGFSTMTSFLPDQGVGVVALANLGGTPAPWLVTLSAYDRLLDIGRIAWSERFRREAEEQKAAAQAGQSKRDTGRMPDTQPSHALECYAGEYEHPGYGALSFRLEDGALHAALNTLELAAEHFHYDTWKLTVPQWNTSLLATFSSDARGDISGVVVPLEPTVRDIVFHRKSERALVERGFLSRFVGEYALSGMSLSVLWKDGTTLQARMPGQPDAELRPRRGTEFVFAELSGYSVEFVVDDTGAVVEAIVSLPYGTYHAPRK